MSLKSCHKRNPTRNHDCQVFSETIYLYMSLKLLYVPMMATAGGLREREGGD